MATGLLSRTEKSVLFVIPTDAGWLIGDTDTPWMHSPDQVVASGADIDYVLAKANDLLTDPLSREDVIGVFAGLRPLVGSADTADTTRLSRREVVERPMPGLTTIAGGKYTTYRVMAAQLVDAAARDLADVPASPTERTPLLGADAFVRRVAPALAARLRARYRGRLGRAPAATLRRPRRGAARDRGRAAAAGRAAAGGCWPPRGRGRARLPHSRAPCDLRMCSSAALRLAITTRDRGIDAA